MLLRSPTASMSVSAGTPPVSFDGETEISCELIGGATVDLNAMTRRGFFRHTLRREQFVGRITIRGVADQTFVVSNGFLELSTGGRDRLRPLDTVAEISPGTALDLYSDQSAEIFIVELTGT